MRCPCSDCQPSVVLKTMSTSPSLSRSTICGRPCATLLTGSTGKPLRLQISRGAARRDDLEAELDQLLDRRHDMVLVGVLDRDERRAALSAGSSPRRCCDLAKAMSKSRAIPMTSPVLFISGAKHRIDAGEAREREHRFLDRDIVEVALDRRQDRPASRPPSPARRSWRSARRSPWRRTGTVRLARGLTSIR